LGAPTGGATFGDGLKPGMGMGPAAA
jgi:hypothetical protein